MPRIRRAGPDDGPAIETVHAGAVREGYRACYAPADVDAWVAGVATWRVGVDPARRDVLVTEEGDRVVGFAALDASNGDVTAVYVDPAAWRRGVGRDLLDAVETIARLRGIATARLDASLNAVAFYEATGWRRERDAKRTLPGGRTIACVAMTKDLPDARLAIREEAPADVASVHEVETFAFDRAGEADLVNRLRADGALAVSLVAELDGHVVGHVAFSPVAIEGARDVVGLGPVAVLPALQTCAIGARMIEEGLASARERGARAAVVLGHPDYYPRFGFVVSTRFGIRYPDVPEDAFMAAELEPGALAAARCAVRYHPAFDGV
jgi:putative acetyltransferase